MLLMKIVQMKFIIRAICTSACRTNVIKTSSVRTRKYYEINRITVCIYYSLLYCLPLLLSVCVIVCLCYCLSVLLSVCVAVRPRYCLSVWLSFCLSNCYMAAVMLLYLVLSCIDASNTNTLKMIYSFKHLGFILITFVQIAYVPMLKVNWVY